MRRISSHIVKRGAVARSVTLESRSRQEEVTRLLCRTTTPVFWARERPHARRASPLSVAASPHTRPWRSHGEDLLDAGSADGERGGGGGRCCEEAGGCGVADCAEAAAGVAHGPLASCDDPSSDSPHRTCAFDPPGEALAVKRALDACLPEVRGTVSTCLLLGCRGED